MMMMMIVVCFFFSGMCLSHSIILHILSSRDSLSDNYYYETRLKQLLFPLLQ